MPLHHKPNEADLKEAEARLRELAPSADYAPNTFGLQGRRPMLVALAAFCEGWLARDKEARK